MALTRDDDVDLSVVTKRRQFLELSHDQWKASKEAREPLEREATVDLQFLNLQQWDEDVVRERGGITGHDKSSLTLDQIGEPYRQLTGRQRQAKPAIQVNPAGDGADQDTAEIFQGLIRHYESVGHAKDARDEAFKGAAGPGWGYYGLLIEDDQPGSFKQSIKYRAVENIFTVFDDPDAQGALKRDRRYLYLIQDLPRAEFERLYPKAQYKCAKDLFGTDAAQLPDWYTDGGARVAEKWYIDDVVDGHVALLSDGREMPLEQATAEVAASQLAAQGPPGAILNLSNATAAVEIVRTKPVIKRVVKWAKISGLEILEGNAGDEVGENTEGRLWPGSHIPFIRVCGERLVLNGKETLRGIVRSMRDPQRLYNFNASCYADELASGPHSKVIMAEGQDEGHEELWNNIERRQLSRLIYKPTVLPDNPMVAAPPPSVALFTDSAKLIALLQAMNQAKMDLKSASGYYDPSDPSRKNTEQSAKAVEARKRESQESASGLMDNYQSALLYEGELLIDLIPKIVVPGQVLRILDMEDEPETIMAGKPYMKGENGNPMELPKDVQFQKGLHQFYDLTVGRFDVAVSVGDDYATRRQQSVNIWMQLINANPALLGIIGDLVISQMDVPGAPAIAERMKKALPPALQQEDDKNTQIPPAVASQIQTLKQQASVVIEQLTAVVHQLQQEKETKQVENDAKLKIAEMDNATKIRIAEMTAMNKEAELRAEQMAQRFEAMVAQHQQMMEHAHQVGMQGAERVHDEDSANQEHERTKELTDMQHMASLAQQQQAADLAPETGANA